MPASKGSTALLSSMQVAKANPGSCRAPAQPRSSHYAGDRVRAQGGHGLTVACKRQVSRRARQ